MKNVSVPYNAPKSMGCYPAGIVKRKSTTSVIRCFTFGGIVKMQGKKKNFGED